MVCAGHKEIRTNRASSLDPLRPCSRHLIRPHNDISSGYQVLSDFVMRGLVRTILTANFDSSLSDALKARQTHIRDGSRSQPPPGNYDQFNVFNKCQLVWLQDALSNIPDKNAAGEVGAPDTNLASLLRPVLDAAPIILIGYRGAEEGIFAQNKEGWLDFPHGIHIRVHS
ncbi:hypothetical protein [Bradyrhizobium sp. 142]|uniref:hypothetical protein n=1 Tax=Bradyrhizobium sp. 142 TaxID=2782618 RepID=UPI001FF9B88D|nr:hypothetical protein [Bradyrhizobium sp. 142]MCK1731642.1 hypothetical protein [Bradyrhizobium sp. 142]